MPHLVNRMQPLRWLARVGSCAALVCALGLVSSTVHAAGRSLSDLSHSVTRSGETLAAVGTVDRPSGHAGKLDPSGWTRGSERAAVPGLAVSPSRSGAAIPNIPGDEKWLPGLGANGVHGVVNALAVDPNGNVYVGGEISVAGSLLVNNIAKWNGTSWSTLGNGVNGTVQALVWDAAHNWLDVGGEFHAVCLNSDCSSTTPAYAVARWNPAAGGSWEALKGLQGEVNALALDNAGTLYAGGWFSRACANASCSSLGLEVNNVARWDVSGNWLPLGTGAAVGVSGAAYALAWWHEPWPVDQDVLVVGGYFDAAGGIPMNNLALWTAALNTWSSFWSGVDGVVYALAVDPTTGSVVVGGSFQNICQIGVIPPDCGTKTRVNYIAIARGLLYWGGLGGGFVVYGTFDPGVKSLSIDSVHKHIYAGGDNSGYCADPSCATWTNFWFVARWDDSGSGAWAGLGSGLGGPMWTTSAHAVAWNSAANALYVGGIFGYAGGSSAERIAKWNGSSWSSLDSGGAPGTTISAVVAGSNSRVYVGGDFRGVGNQVMNRVAVWNNLSRTWARLGYGVDSWVNALTLDANGNVYAAGNFGSICTSADCSSPGVRANHIARWTASGESGTWSSLGLGLWGSIYALAWDHHGRLYAGGWSISICGDVDCTAGARTAAKNLVVWNGTQWSPVNLGPRDEVDALVVDGNDNLYVGGYFAYLCGNIECTVDGQQVNNIAEWTPAPGGGGNWSSVENGLDSRVDSLTVDRGNTLYVGGQFQYICAAPSCTGNARRVNGIAKWNGASWSALGNGIMGSVSSLALDERGQLYAGGGFIDLCADEACATNGARANHVAKWDGVSWSPLGSGIGVTNQEFVNALTCGQGILSVGGDFDTAGGKLSVNLAQYQGGSIIHVPLIRR